PRKSRAMASASLRSHLVFEAWTALMAQACPRAKGRPCSRQVSASQYQVWTHSHPTSRSGRNGSTAARNGSGLAGRLRASRRLPAWSRTQRNSVLACRSTPTYDAAVAVRNRMVKSPGARETGTFNSIQALQMTGAANGSSVYNGPRRPRHLSWFVRWHGFVSDDDARGKGPRPCRDQRLHAKIQPGALGDPGRWHSDSSVVLLAVPFVFWLDAGGVWRGSHLHSVRTPGSEVSSLPRLGIVVGRPQ